jgi:maleate isomerase
MYGWRARIGVIVSPPNTVVENEFPKMTLEGVSAHAARLGRPQGAPGQLSGDVVLQTNQDLPRAAASLAELKPDVVVFAHTAGSMLRGPEYDAELVAMLGDIVGCPAVTTASAAVAALRASGATTLALLTPYPEEMTLKEQQFIEEAMPGMKVISHRSLGVASGLAIGNMGPTVAYREARRVNTPEAEALFLSGTNWRTIEVIEALESDLGKPVFTANQVTMWATLRQLGIQPRPGYGSVFSYH